jgi:hypothetical protein
MPAPTGAKVFQNPIDDQLTEAARKPGGTAEYESVHESIKALSTNAHL